MPSSVPPLKKCGMCKELKPIDAFARRSNRPCGYQGRCKDCQRITLREWQNANRDRVRELGREWTEQHRDRVREIDRARHERSKDQRNAALRQRASGNKAYHQERNRQWRKASPDKVLASSQRRRALKKAAPGNHTAAQWEALCAYFGGVCLCCGAIDRITVDHVVPFSNGGSNDVANLQPLCASCNSSKQARSSVDYRDPDRLAAFLAQLS